MNKDFLISALQSMENAKRENRDKVANIVYNNKELFKHLISLTFVVDDKISIKAAWILEWICTHGKLHLLYQHLDAFTQQIATVKLDSAIRLCSKIFQFLANEKQTKND